MRKPRTRPEGWRTLKVGELVLWWTVGQPRVTAELSGGPDRATCQAIRLTVTVERADGSGKKLVATVQGQRALTVPVAGFTDVQTIAIEPAAVRRLVETAAPRGAWPTGPGVLRCALELPSRPLPTDLTFRPEHLDRLEVVWARE